MAQRRSKDEDVGILKEIMRAAASIELEAMDFSAFASQVRAKLEKGNQIDRAIAEPQMDAYIREVSTNTKSGLVR